MLAISLIFLITVTGITRCGGSDKENTRDTKTSAVKEEVQNPAVVADTQATIPANRVNTTPPEIKCISGTGKPG